MIAQMLAALAIKALLMGVGFAIGGPAGAAVAGMGTATAIPGGNPFPTPGASSSAAQSSILAGAPIPMGKSGGSTINAITVNNISAVDTQSFADAVKRNPDAFAPVMRYNLENSPGVQTSFSG